MSFGRPVTILFDYNTIQIIIGGRLSGKPWNIIANEIHVTAATLYEWRMKTGFVDPLRRISDDDLS